jgi:PAS domain S-box-containing protein
VRLADLVRMLAEPLDVAVVLTDVDLERPGPTILYANPAFARMSGYAPEDVIGRSPRMLQGPATNLQVTRLLPRALRAQGRFLGCLQNYRRSGEAYLCELDVRPLQGRDGQPIAFIAFEREVVRRKGRPSGDGSGRYTPVDGDPAPVTALALEPAIFS